MASASVSIFHDHRAELRQFRFMEVRRRGQSLAMSYQPHREFIYDLWLEGHAISLIKGGLLEPVRGSVIAEDPVHNADCL